MDSPAPHKHIFDSDSGFVITSDKAGPVYSLHCQCKKVWQHYRAPEKEGK